MTLKTGHKAGIAGGVGVILACVSFLPAWEGTDYVAKRDVIGTGHPITYCHGQTDEFGKVKAGTRFTKEQCDDMLAKSLPPYLERINACINVEMPDKTKAAFLDAAYNAGSAAVCHSPMVRKANAGDMRGACEAFRGWYVTSDHQVRKGLVARRSGVGDGRKSERDLCLEGLNAPNKPTPRPATIAAIKVVVEAKPKKHWWSWS